MTVIMTEGGVGRVRIGAMQKAPAHMLQGFITAPRRLVCLRAVVCRCSAQVPQHRVPEDTEENLPLGSGEHPSLPSDPTAEFMAL